MRTTVTIDDDLLVEVKELAARERRTLSDIVQDSLRASLSRLRSVEEQPPVRVELPTFGGPGATMHVNILDKEALAEAIGDNEPAFRAL